MFALPTRPGDPLFNAALHRPARFVRRHPLRALLAVALLASLPFGAAGADGTDGLSDSEAANFLASLQDAIRTENPNQVAVLVKFPLRVGYPSKQSARPLPAVQVRNAAELVRRYSEIFTPEVRAAVLAQSPDTLFRNWQGAMVGNGELWFTGVCLDSTCSRHRVRVISINAGK
jgi:hypothetical protein